MTNKKADIDFPTPVCLQNWTHGIRLESAFYLVG
jgi:hypothetical protein